MKYPHLSSELLNTFSASRAQIRQDMFVLAELNFKRRGYFVEFGATDGIEKSNTYILEKLFDWTGCLAEPGRDWHMDLKRNRSVNICTDCVYSETGQQLMFSMTSDGELSTLTRYHDVDDNAGDRETSKEYLVDSISLLDLLKEYEAPKVIDDLSIDTEGSEFEFLKAFDFSKYDIQLITVEHNYTANREQIKNLLEKNGFELIHEDISFFDDWYMKII